MPKAVKCYQCGKMIAADARNYGRFVGGVLYSLCSELCRMNYQAGEPAASPKPRKAKPRPVGHVSEQQISNAIGQHFDALGLWNTRLNSGKIRVTDSNGKSRFITLCRPGTPDRVAATGLITFVEVKAAGETMSAEQRDVAERLKKSGALVFCVDSIEAFLKVKNAVGRRSAAIKAIARMIAELQSQIDAEIAAD